VSDDKWLGVICGNILLTSLNIQTERDGKSMRIMPDNGARSQGHPRPRPQGRLQFATRRLLQLSHTQDIAKVGTVQVQRRRPAAVHHEGPNYDGKRSQVCWAI